MPFIIYISHHPVCVGINCITTPTHLDSIILYGLLIHFLLSTVKVLFLSHLRLIIFVKEMYYAVHTYDPTCSIS